jgi:alkaline phosphatase
MMDDLLGAMLDIDDSVAEIMAWIDANGGYEKNALYVTADHDHYLTLLPRKRHCTQFHML